MVKPAPLSLFCGTTALLLKSDVAFLGAESLEQTTVADIDVLDAGIYAIAVPREIQIDRASLSAPDIRDRRNHPAFKRQLWTCHPYNYAVKLIWSGRNHGFQSSGLNPRRRYHAQEGGGSA